MNVECTRVKLHHYREGTSSDCLGNQTTTSIFIETEIYNIDASSSLKVALQSEKSFVQIAELETTLRRIHVRDCVYDNIAADALSQMHTINQLENISENLLTNTEDNCNGFFSYIF